MSAPTPVHRFAYRVHQSLGAQSTRCCGLSTALHGAALRVFAGDPCASQRSHACAHRPQRPAAAPVRAGLPRADRTPPRDRRPAVGDAARQRLHPGDASGRARSARRARQHARAGAPAALLYTVAQAEACLEQLQGVAYDEDVQPHSGVRCRFRDAGHILGSAIVEVWVSERARTRKLVFSGDLGQPGRPDRARPDADRRGRRAGGRIDLRQPAAPAAAARPSTNWCSSSRTRCGAARATSSSRPSRSGHAGAAAPAAGPVPPGPAAAAAGLRRFTDGRQGDRDHLATHRVPDDETPSPAVAAPLAPGVAGPALHAQRRGVDGAEPHQGRRHHHLGQRHVRSGWLQSPDSNRVPHWHCG